jgi:hypothetical protein
MWNKGLGDDITVSSDPTSDFLATNSDYAANADLLPNLPAPSASGIMSAFPTVFSSTYAPSGVPAGSGTLPAGSGTPAATPISSSTWMLILAAGVAVVVLISSGGGSGRRR